MMMKNLWFYVFLFYTFHLMADSGRVRLSGKVDHQTHDKLSLKTINSQTLSTADLKADGSFKMSFKIDNEGYFKLEYGRNSTYLYLMPKDDLSLEVDAKNFQNSLKFEGLGKVRNNYLAQKTLLEAKLTENLKLFYASDEDVYLQNILNLKNSHLELLDQYDTEKSFRKAESKSLEYERLLSIQNFKNNYKFYIGEDIEPSENFYAPINTIDVDDQAEYLSQPYYQYLVNSIWSNRIADRKDVEGMLDEFRKIRFEALALNLLKGFYSKISSKEPRAKDYLDLVKKLTNHQPFIEACEKKYAEITALNVMKKGVKSPEFEYEDINGNLVSLDDLKGKFVYIDVWATWCVPCLKQIPYIKALEEEFRDANIAFVSISVDKEREKTTWKKAVEKKALPGIQLFADKSFDSDFMNAFAVNSIPRFIIIDPEGHIVDPEAPRPSFDKTRQVIFDLLKNKN